MEFGRFTEGARKVMVLASEEAQRLKPGYVESDHILLGILREDSGIGARVLNDLGADWKKVRTKLDNLVKSGDFVIMGNLPHIPSAKKIIESAIEYARKIGDDYIDSEHLVYGLLTEKGTYSPIFRDLGINAERYHERLMELKGGAKSKQYDSGVDIIRFIEMHGFITRVQESGDEIDIYGKQGEVVCYLPIKQEPIKYGTPTLRYGSTLDSLRESLKLRDIFDEQKVEYSENPPRREVAENLRNSVRETITLADKVEGIK